MSELHVYGAILSGILYKEFNLLSQYTDVHPSLYAISGIFHVISPESTAQLPSTVSILYHSIENKTPKGDSMGCFGF